MILQPLDQTGGASLVGPGWDDARQVVVSPRVRIDIRLNVDSLAASFVDQLDDLAHSPPQRLFSDLQVDDVDRDLGAAADADRFLDGIQDLRPFIADMRGVNAAVAFHHLAKLDQVVGRDGELAGRGQHGREPEGAVAHRLVEKLLHGCDLRAAGARERITLHALKQRAQADVARHVDGDAVTFDRRRNNRPVSSRCSSHQRG